MGRGVTEEGGRGRGLGGLGYRAAFGFFGFGAGRSAATARASVAIHAVSAQRRSGTHKCGDAPGYGGRRGWSRGRGGSRP